jgi:hypothetical protein
MSAAVEYHDPSGLFSLISPDIASRLPLRNLQWQNATRPLRQIKSLHLDFVPDAFTKNSLRPPVQRSDSDRTSSFDIVRSGADLRKNAVKERRHQIPGFQATPYLRIYILRSDDKDTYKATERQKIQAWIRDCAASTSKGKAENHDAFEWLIIHVVVPDTTAASEPRWREPSTKDSDELKERKQGIKLPGKSTRTVFDKLRADFNESGKHSQDRVAQIRLTRAQMPSDLLPTPAVATTIEETNEERDTAWSDLMGKFKTLILGPFDLRVRQYEADVASQELRRAMPGFNFCTFFIQKEGLAKALESIGLVEDALVIYDELSLGLETVIRDLARDQAEGTATTFAPYTHDFADRIAGPNLSKTNGTASADAALYGDTGKETLEVDYREKIVRSDISVFDFFSYLFARQKALILRIANAKAATSFTKDGVENILLISEVCWRAMSFIHNNARTLRHDLATLRHAQWEKKAGHTLTGADIESLVCSWTYTVAGRILDETESSSVDQFSDLNKRDSMMNGSIHNQNRSDSYLPGGVSAHPHRTTSLPPKKSRVSELQHRTSFQSASESDLTSPRSSTANDEYLKPGVVATGLLELVTYRAELLMMQRRMLELLAKQRGWLAGWATLKEHRTAKMEDVDLNGDTEPSTHENEIDTNAAASNLTTPALAHCLQSEESFYKMYEQLSDRAMRLYVAATQTKTAESIMGDLAILKSQQGDYEYAVSYFQHVLPLYATDGWSLMEDEALKMHAHCLKQLDRGEEYVTALLTLLAKACARLKAAKRPFRTISAMDGMMNIDGIFPDVVEFSRSLDGDVTNPAEHFFSDISLEREIMHLEEMDGFALRLHLCHLLDDDLQLDYLAARLVHTEDPNMEIWVTNEKAGRLQCGTNTFTLEAHVIAFGPYVVDRVVVQTGKLYFIHEFSSGTESQPTPLGIVDLEASNALPSVYKQPWVFLYPSSLAFDAEIRLARDIQVAKTRHLEVELKSGWNVIESIDIRLKPASAGLRLHLADTTLESIDAVVDEEPKPGQISLGGIESDSSALVKIPYSLEQASPDILIRFEADFKTSTGSFSLCKAVRLVIELPLDVDVNDMFRLDYLLSKFSLRSTSGVPVNITEAELAPSLVYNVEGPPILQMPITIFEKQPINLMYKITRNLTTSPSNTKSAALALCLKYCSMEELVFNILQEKMVKALESSAFTDLSRLLIPLLRERGKRLYSRSELELATILDEAKVSSFEDIGWSEVIKTLPSKLHSELSQWLQVWHKENDRISLNQDEPHVDALRSITISVDVPRVDYVHETSLSILNQGVAASRDPQILVLGVPVQTRLVVASTRNWSDAATLQSDENEEQQQQSEADFLVTIHADPEYWLVGGQRRARFTARSDAESSFHVMLIPLRLGMQSLPTVDVQPCQAHQIPGGTNKPMQPSTVSCETHYQSAGLIFHVIRGVRTSRVSVAESASAGHPPSRPSTTATAKEPG